MAVAVERREGTQPARPLGNRAYTDPAFFAAEIDRLWGTGWLCLGFAHEVPEPGHVLPVELAGKPLLLVRDHTGGLRVFWNVCRHRGLQLVTAPGRLSGVIRCPYHSWCYALDGALKVTPHVGGPGMNTDPAIDRTALGLLEVRAAEWQGCVFVDLSGTAEPFADFILPLARRWADFMDRPLHPGDADCSFTLEVACNWKLAVENYCESYHLPWVHPGLNSYSRLEDHVTIVDESFAGQGTLAYRPLLAPDGSRLPGFTGLPERWREGAEYVALYPNLLLGAHKDHLFALRLEPLAPDRTREHVALWFADARALDAAHAPLRRRLAELWREVFKEDIAVVEGMQRGRHADAFDGGVLSPVMDAATAAFHAWVQARYDAVGLAHG
jgi:phenylpropionate dioxygenase-like ring-hydroxylating dioxygenase large terminal subunit